MKQKNIAVIGGGASGMMAAITAAKNGGNVTLIEGNDRLGKKILATGNGKCNFSNTDMSVEHFYTPDTKFVSTALKQFDEVSAQNFFAELGMLIFNREGYLYPASEQASTVLELLLLELQKRKICIVTETKIRNIIINDSHQYNITINDREEIFDSVIIACGSNASPKSGSDGTGYKLAKKLGHTVKEPVPALVQLRCKEELKLISGVRAKVSLELLVEGKKVATEEGELQFTDYGISGIVVFQISRIAAYALKENKNVSVKVNFMRDMSSEEYTAFMEKRFETLSDRTVEEFFLGMLNKKLISYFLNLSGLNPNQPVKECDRAKLEKVFSFCRNFNLQITATNSFDQAQVCAGGVVLTEVSENMESKIHPGLYFAGEILDVDGKCGGYNLQWAWTSGYIAGLNAAK